MIIRQLKDKDKERKNLVSGKSKALTESKGFLIRSVADLPSETMEARKWDGLFKVLEEKH